MSIFAGPTTRFNPGRIQGHWFRWVLERPSPQGWVAALDSATVRQGGHDTPIPTRYADLLAGHAFVQEALCPHARGGHLRAWDGAEAEAPPCMGTLPDDLSRHSHGWAGPGWVQGWPNEYPVEVGCTPWPMETAWVPTWWQHLAGLLNHLDTQGFPYGIGWRLPTTAGSKEAERAPWRQSAHALLAQRADMAIPSLWNPHTGRVVWALMAYVAPRATRTGTP